MHIGKGLRRIRESKQLTQREVSLGIISVSHYSNIEAGRFEPSTDILQLLANRFDVPEKYFLDFSKECSITDKRIKKFKEIVNSKNVENIIEFENTEVLSLNYISSIKQEFQFNLIKYMALVELDKINEAITHYSINIAYITCDEIEQMSLSVQEIFFYVSGLNNFFTKDYIVSINLFKYTFDTTKDNSLKSKLLYNISLAFYRLFDYVQAIKYAKKAENWYLSLHNWYMAADCYNLIAALLIKINQLKEAKEYIDKGINILKLQNETNIIHAKLLHNLSLINFRQKEYEQASKTINKSIDIRLKCNSTSTYYSQLIKMNIFLETGNILAFNENMDFTLGLVKNDLDKANMDFLSAKMYYSLEEFSLYNRLIKSCINVFIKKSDWLNVLSSANHYANYLAKIKKYKQAFEYQKICTEAYQRTSETLYFNN